jgi:hypothetical protein
VNVLGEKERMFSGVVLLKYRALSARLVDLYQGPCVQECDADNVLALASGRPIVEVGNDSVGRGNRRRALAAPDDARFPVKRIRLQRPDTQPEWRIA